MTSAEHAILLLFVALGAFLLGRWRGIQEFDKAMVEAGKLPPRGGPGAV